MKDVKLSIDKRIKYSEDVYLMRLVGDTSEIKKPGEFINVSLPGLYLRRPISVFDFSSDFVDILYKVVGEGTKLMNELPLGTKLDVLVGLGNGFEIKKDINPLLVAGGIGIAPLFAIAKEYNKLGIKPTLVYGARSKNDLVMSEEFSEICDVYLCTDDGSAGYKGNVLDCIKENNIKFDYYYSCGPYKMLEFLAKTYPNGCVSLEARMGCGFGACMGCSIQTVNGPRRVCKEGPVFEATEVIF